MSSSVVARITHLRDPHASRTGASRRVFEAAATLLDESPAMTLSIPVLAARARIAGADLVRQFSSFDALFAELYLHRVCSLPLIIDQTARKQTRVSEQLRAITLVMADEPKLAAACTEALLQADDLAVAGIRRRIAAEVHRRIAAALGTGEWPEVQATLETLFWGALLQVQLRSMSYRGMAAQLDTMVSLILQDL